MMASFSRTPPPAPPPSSPSRFRFDIHSLIQCVNAYPNISQWLLSQPQRNHQSPIPSNSLQICPGSLDHLMYLQDTLELDIYPRMEISYGTDMDHVSYGHGTCKACKGIPMVRLHTLDVDITYIPCQQEMGNMDYHGVLVAYGIGMRLVACMNTVNNCGVLSMDDVLGCMITVLTKDDVSSIDLMQETDPSNSVMDHFITTKKHDEHEAVVSPIPSTVTMMTTTTTMTTSTVTKEQVLSYIQEVNQMPATPIQRYECKLCQVCMPCQPRPTFARKYDLRRHLVTKHVPESDLNDMNAKCAADALSEETISPFILGPCITKELAAVVICGPN
eukprot:CAMPEP_0184706370 /NCGR_PEP_ID=MMETSP0313-20130426/36725_1 /TAXON_ID=2792 /ORGANISM="Porphyridium aerugineum, Strain SAG 1380-2" /LENGTH=330 /DNA_ID=CAMNT_0027167923 /DNA_START=441 /DNA_END=1434 /DNA_ORIENTATION=+